MKLAARLTGRSVEEVIEIAAMTVRNAIRITTYETDVFPAISCSESPVSSSSSTSGCHLVSLDSM